MRGGRRGRRRGARRGKRRRRGRHRRQPWPRATVVLCNFRAELCFRGARVGHESNEIRLSSRSIPIWTGPFQPTPRISVALVVGGSSANSSYHSAPTGNKPCREQECCSPCRQPSMSSYSHAFVIIGSRRLVFFVTPNTGRTCSFACSFRLSHGSWITSRNGWFFLQEGSSFSLLADNP